MTIERWSQIVGVFTILGAIAAILVLPEFRSCLGLKPHSPNDITSESPTTGKGTNNNSQSTAQTNNSSTNSSSQPTPTQTPSISSSSVGSSTSSTTHPAAAQSPNADTIPGTILELGQSWHQDGLELAFMKSDWRQGDYTFILTNLESRDRHFLLSLQNFAAIDSLNRSVHVIPDANIKLSTPCPPIMVTLRANDTLSPLEYSLRCQGYYGPAGPFGFKIGANLADLSITQIVFIARNISSITEARWRIPIYH